MTQEVGVWGPPWPPPLRTPLLGCLWRTHPPFPIPAVGERDSEPLHVEWTRWERAGGREERALFLEVGAVRWWTDRRHTTHSGMCAWKTVLQCNMQVCSSSSLHGSCPMSSLTTLLSRLLKKIGSNLLPREWIPSGFLRRDMSTCLPQSLQSATVKMNHEELVTVSTAASCPYFIQCVHCG